MNASYDILLARIARILRRHAVYGFAEAIIAAAAVSVLLFLGFTVAEALFYMPPQVRTPLFYTVAASFAVTFVMIAALRLIVRRPGIEDAARMAERAFPALGDQFISAVQLGHLDKDDLRGQSAELVEALVDRAEEKTRTLDLSRAVPREPLVMAWRSMAAVTAVLLLLSILMPGRMTGAMYRLVDHNGVYQAPDAISIYLFKSGGSIIRGEDYTVSGMLSGWSPEPLNIYYRWDDSGTWHVKPVDVEQVTGRFTATVENPRLSFTFYLETAGTSTPRHRVEVIERPVVESIAYTLDYPAYTGLGSVRGEEGEGNIRALIGTRATVRIRVNKILAGMSVNWSDTTSIGCPVDGDTGSFSFVIDKTVDYRIDITDTLGIANIDPITYRVTCLIDEPPSVTIASPPPDVTIPISMAFPLVYRAHDDYGLTSVTLKYKLPFEEEPRTESLKRGSLGRSIEEIHDWDLSNVGLLPGDTVIYHLSVLDNDTVNGPKEGVSETGTLRVPSMTDFFSDVNEEQEKGIDRLRDISERSTQDDASLDEVRRNVISGEELEWSDRNAIEQARENMESMQNQMKDLADETKRMADKLSEEDMAAIETIEKYNRISNLMDQIAEGEMKDALRRLTQAGTQLDPRMLKEAIEQHKVSTADIKKKLDRIIELLEQVKSLQRFEMAKRLVEEIAAKQAEIAAKFKDNPGDPGLVREQERLATEMAVLEKELAETAKELGEKFDMDTQKYQEYFDVLDIADTMNATAKSMPEGDKAETSDRLDQANAKLSELLSQMDELGKSMKDSNSEEMMRRLNAALNALLAVSDIEERLIGDINKGAVPNVENDNPAKRQLEVVDAFAKARKQLESFGEMAVEAAGVIDAMAGMVDATMRTSVDAFAMGQTDKGAGVARKALGDVNNVIHVLTMIVGQEQGDSMGMPGDLMQQLQQIANGQLSLQMQMSGEGGKQLMMQLAAEQQKLAEMLSELGKKAMEDARLRQMLEKLAEDMDDTSGMMKRNEPRELVERKQLDIYRRLMDARRSRREKDEREERRSYTAKRNVSRGADELAGDLGEKKREIGERINQAMQDDFDPEYLRLIRRYFESMLRDYETPESVGIERGQP